MEEVEEEGLKELADELLSGVQEEMNPEALALMIAEVEFSTQEAAMAFLPPDWLAEDVTYDPHHPGGNCGYALQ